MTSFRPKLWTSASMALLLGVAACGEAGEGGPKADQATSANAPAAGEGGEGGAEGGAGGEAGAQAAYLGVPAESRAALRLAHLKGFFLIAQRQTEGADAAAALAGQGMLEVYDAAPGAFEATGVDVARLKKAAETGAPADLTAAIAAIDAAMAKAGGDPVAVANGLVSISQGLYANVTTPAGVDPTEYQHSLGAALAAQSVIAAAKDPRAAKAKPEVDKLVAMWPATEAPATPAPAGQVAAQASRAQLALQ
jgi:hypothetical protein